MISNKPFELYDGANFEIGDVPHTVLKIKGMQVTLENESQLITVNRNTLMMQYRQGLIKPVCPAPMKISLILNLTPKQREVMQFREEVVKEMLVQAPNAATVPRNILCAYEVIKKRYAGKTLKVKFPDPTTAARWLKRYRNNSFDPYALLDNAQQTQGKGKLQPIEVEELMFQMLCTHYLDKRESIPTTHKHLKEKMAETLPGYKCPSQSSLYSRLDELDPEFVKYHREGPHAQSQESRQAIKKYEIYYPYARWEMDGIVAQVGVLCPKTYEFLGIATIMLVMDCFTRAIAGYSVLISEKKAETSELAVACFKNAVLPNEDGSGFYGLPHALAADAGSALVSTAFTHFLALTGVNRFTTVVKRPQRKGFIERFNLTFRIECLEKMPGYKGNLKLNEKFIIQDDVRGAATLTLPEFLVSVDRYIEDYNNSAHSSLYNCSPIAVWEEYVSSNKGLVRLPGDDTTGNQSQQLFENFSGRCKEVTLQKNKGIVIDNRFYNSHKLNDKFKRLIGVKKGMTVYYDHIDISKVVVISPGANEFAIVPITDHFVSGKMSKGEYEAFKRAPYANIPKAKDRLWTSADDILDGAVARRLSQETEKKSAAAKARRVKREKELEYSGVDIEDGEGLHEAIKNITQMSMPNESVLIEAEHSDVNTVSIFGQDNTFATGGIRGEF